MVILHEQIIKAVIGLAKVYQTVGLSTNDFTRNSFLVNFQLRPNVGSTNGISGLQHFQRFFSK